MIIRLSDIGKDEEQVEKKDGISFLERDGIPFLPKERDGIPFLPNDADTGIAEKTVVTKSSGNIPLSELPSIEEVKEISEPSADTTHIEDNPLSGELGVFDNPDGTTSTEKSITVNIDGKFYNIPTLVQGQVDAEKIIGGEEITEEQNRIAIERFKSRGGFEKLDGYSSLVEAEEAAQERSNAKGLVKKFGEPDKPYYVNPDLADAAVGLGIGMGNFLVTATTDLFGALIGTFAAGEKMIIDALDPDTDVDINTIPGMVNFVRDALRYEPTSPEGQAALGMIGDIFHALLTQPGHEAGDYVIEETNSPGLATAVDIAPTALFMLLPFAGRMKTKDTQNIIQNAKDAKNNKDVNIFSDANMVQLAAATEKLAELRNKPALELTATDVTLFNHLKVVTTELNKKLADTHGQTYVVMKKTEQVVRRITDIDKLKLNSELFVNIMKEAKENKGKPVIREPIELVIDGTNTIVTKGAEHAMAALLLGANRIPVRVIVPKPKTKDVAKDASKVQSSYNKGVILKNELNKGVNRTILEKIHTAWDITATFKTRIKSSLGRAASAPVVAAFEAMENAGSSAAAFARVAIEPIAKELNATKIILQETINGKLVKLSEVDLFNQIVQARVAKQISERKGGEFRFSSGLTAKEFSSNLLNLTKKLGAEQFHTLNVLADRVFDVYRGLIDLRLREGLIDQTLANKLREFDYSPTKYQELMLELESSVEGMQSVGSGVKRLKHGRVDITEFSAFEMLSSVVYGTYNLVARNRVMTELANAYRNNPTGQFSKHVQVMKSPRHRVKQGNVKVLFRELGKNVALEVDAFIAKTWVTPKDVAILRGTSTAFRILTGVAPVKAISVGLEFAFPIVEIPRSIIGVGLSNTVSMAGKPLFGGSNIVTQTLAGLPISAAQMLTQMSKVVHESFKEGGIFKTKDFQTLAENNGIPQFIAEIGLKEFKDLTANVTNTLAKKILTTTSQGLSAAGIFSEALIRTSIFKQGKAKGLSDAQAAAESLRFVNYNNVGYITGPADSVIPFANAAFQATKSQVRGIAEAPLRGAGYGVSVMSTAISLYYMNWLVNPEGMQQVADDDLGTGFVFVLPKTFSYRNSEGETRHRYVKIPADGMAVPFIAAAGYSMRKYNENREPSSMIFDSIQKSTFPFLDIGSSIPAVNAAVAMFGNYDTFRQTDVYPREVASSLQEFYGAHEERATPQIYIQAAQMMHDNGIINLAKDSGWQSPERLKAAVNSYIPNHTLFATFNYMESMLDPNLYEYYNKNQHLADNLPLLGRVLKESRPGMNPADDMRNSEKPETKARIDAVVMSDKLAFLMTHENFSLETMKNKFRSMPGIDENYKVSLIKRTYFISETTKLFKNMSEENLNALPPIRWWGNLNAIDAPKDRAREFFEQWKKTDPKKRQNLENFANRLSVIGGKRFDISNGRFLQEFRRLKNTEDTDFEQGIFLNSKTDRELPEP